jgi:hypothetical protein
VKVLTIPPQQPASPYLLTSRMIIRFEPPFGWNDPKLTAEPNVPDSLQREIAVKPAKALSPHRLPLSTQGFP